MPSAANPEKCSGCGTCVEKCPEMAIAMVDGMPVVNEELCVECGLCVILCPFQARDIVALIGALT